MALPWAMALDVSYVGQHQYDILQNMDLNRVDFGAAFLPENQDRTLAASATPGAAAVATDLMRSFRGYSSITQTSGWLEPDLSLAAAVAPAPVPQRPLVRVQRHHRALRSPEHDAAAAARRRRDGLDPGGSGRGRSAARQQQSAGPHHQGELRLGLPDVRRRDAADQDRRRDRQRLAAGGHLDRGDRQRLRDRLQLQQRRRQREPDRVAGLRRAHPHRRRHRQRLQRRRPPPVQRGGVPGPADGHRSVSSPATTT